MKNPGKSLSRSAVAALSLGAVLMVVTACGSSPAAVEPSPATSTAVESAPASAAPSSAPAIPNPAMADTSGHKPGDVVNGLPTLPELANDGKGEYIQTTISDDDPAMKFNPALVTADSEAGLFTDEELAEAQKFIVRFIAEETIDSVINNNTADHANVDRWVAKNKHKFDPEYGQANFDPLYSESLHVSIVHRSNHRAADSGLIYGADKTRVTERKITVNKITTKTVNGKKYAGFDFTAHYAMSRFRDGNLIRPEYTDAAINYTLRKSDTGEWVISGGQNTFTTDR